MENTPYCLNCQETSGRDIALQRTRINGSFSYICVVCAADTDRGNFLTCAEQAASDLAFERLHEAKKETLRHFGPRSRPGGDMEIRNPMEQR